MAHTLTVADRPTDPPGPERVKLVDGVLAELRTRLLAADRFEVEANCPPVQQGWEATPCGTRFPRYVWSNTTTYHFSIVTGPPVAEFTGMHL